jgi:hypothetical protein
MKEAREGVAVTHSLKCSKKYIFNFLNPGAVFPACHTDLKVEGFPIAHAEKHQFLLSKSLTTCEIILPLRVTD